jgi:oxygen-independent coproporphyrinogen-3 oxidase
LQEESAAVNDAVRRYARLQVPRYTSYPTAAEFTTNVGAPTNAGG